MKSSEKTKVNNSLRLIAKTSIIVFIGMVLSKIFTYTYRIIVARAFGPEIYGLFILATIIIGWFVAFSSLGLSRGLLRYIPLYRGEKSKEKIKYVYKIALYLTVFLGIFSGLILFFLSEFIATSVFNNLELIYFLKVFSILIPISLIAAVFLAVIRSFERISAHSLFQNILQNGLRLLLLVIFIFLGLNQNNSIIFSHFSGVFLLLLLSYFYCRFKLPQIFAKYSLEPKTKSTITSSLISFSWPLMFLGILIMVFNWTDSILIGYFNGVAEVGLYNAAVPFILLFNFFPGLFMQLFAPLITKEYAKRNLKLIRELSKQVGKWMIILNLPLFLILFIFPGAIINIFFGQEYLAAQTALKILAVGGFLFHFTTLPNDLILMTGRSKLILTNFVVTTILNIILNILLISKYGINGAAIATSIVWFIFALVLFLEAKIHVGVIPFRKKTWKILLVSIIPALLLAYVKQFLVINLLILIFLGLAFVLIYVFLIFMTKCLDKNDLMILHNIGRKLVKHKKLSQ